MSAVRQGVRRAMAAALPASRFVVRGPAGSGDVALTFDDGPHPEHTPRLLDALARHGIPATFFVVGRAAERHPALVQRIVREGHALGHHSWTHSEPAATPAATLADEVDRCRALLASLVGRDVNLFRPPKGQLSLAKCVALWQRRQQVALWSDDPRDYALPDATALRRWAATTTPADGAIVLLHDVHPHAAAALEAIAAWRDRGRRFVNWAAWWPDAGAA